MTTYLTFKKGILTLSAVLNIKCLGLCAVRQKYIERNVPLHSAFLTFISQNNINLNKTLLC